MSAWEKYKNAMAAEAKPWDLLYPTRYADAETAEKRYQICSQCPELIQGTKQCKKCMCFMFLKTKIEHAVCPIKKW